MPFDAGVDVGVDAGVDWPFPAFTRRTFLTVETSGIDIAENFVVGAPLIATGFIPMPPIVLSDLSGNRVAAELDGPTMWFLVDDVDEGEVFELVLYDAPDASPETPLSPFSELAGCVSVLHLQNVWRDVLAPGGSLTEPDPSTYDDGNFGRGARFDTVDDPADSAQLDVSMSSELGAVSLWFNFRAADANDPNVLHALWHFSDDDGGDLLGERYEHTLHYDNDNDSRRLEARRDRELEDPFSDGFTAVSHAGNPGFGWHHALVSWETGAEIALYLDGEVTSAPLPIDAFPAFTSLRIGGPPELDPDNRYRGFAGRVDEIRIYDSPKSANFAAAEHALEDTQVTTGDTESRP